MFEHTSKHIDHLVSAVEMPAISNDAGGGITGDICDVTITISILLC